MQNPLNDPEPDDEYGPPDELEMRLRAILVEEIKRRDGPQDYTDRLANKWQEIDSELPPELSYAVAAMKRAYQAGRDSVPTNEAEF